MNTVKLIQFFLLAACLSNQMHQGDFKMAGMRRAIEQSTKDPYKAAYLEIAFKMTALG